MSPNTSGGSSSPPISGRRPHDPLRCVRRPAARTALTPPPPRLHPTRQRVRVRPNRLPLLLLGMPAMRIGYADPPYPGQAARHYKHHPDYAGEVDHVRLLADLAHGYDGWVLHTSSPALYHVLRCAGAVGSDY